jgi:hypothetical protein
MKFQLSLRCEEHPDPFVCADKLIHHSAEYDEYGIIIHDGGTSYSVVQFCPWCGAQLPESKRAK